MERVQLEVFPRLQKDLAEGVALNPWTPWLKLIRTVPKAASSAADPHENRSINVQASERRSLILDLCPARKVAWTLLSFAEIDRSLRVATSEMLDWLVRDFKMEPWTRIC